ncbi:hypothetical protein COT49_02790 [candidate division WWE3 bacterium CG08_land_8_20_14_0_20_40_13]|uniref:Solute-binding protein family 5 domain-containing protein n=1 Tax=candidate division WWE3 bacterium CG08_land_8_20_14_0_20_40_13 TaxID=1975084 RepID=A0A2H0XDH6_UNCKA|nr:MAG: hypothetical protein COT49_02790 [candidate division WWE3 bacterium CG08_land_8_20_14_0_20_40_13]
MTPVIGFLYSILLFLESIFATNSYIEGVQGFIYSLDPVKAQSDAEKTVAHLLNRSLFKYDSENKLTGDLAKSYEISDDGLTYTVTLSPDNYWHDGRAITADDVIYTASQYQHLRDIGTDKIGDFSVRFSLPNKYSPFLSVLTFPIVNYINSDTRSGDFYLVKIKRTSEGIKELTLFTTNTNYKINKIVFKFYSKESDLFIAYKLGEIDGFLSPSNFSWVGLSKKEISLLGRYFVLHFNTAREVFSNKDNRKLAVESVNLEKMQKQFIKNPNIKTEGVISGSLYTKKDLTEAVFNPNATPLKTPLKIKAIVPDLAEMNGMISYIFKSFESVGFNIEVSKLSSTGVQEAISLPRDYDIFILGEEVGRDPDRYVFWHSTQKDPPGLNLSSLSNLRVDKALEKGREETAFETRQGDYNIFQSAVNEESPAIYLYHPGLYYYLSDKIVSSNFENLYYPYERFDNLVSWKMGNEL